MLIIAHVPALSITRCCSWPRRSRYQTHKPGTEEGACFTRPHFGSSFEDQSPTSSHNQHHRLTGHAVTDEAPGMTPASQLSTRHDNGEEDRDPCPQRQKSYSWIRLVVRSVDRWWACGRANCGSRVACRVFSGVQILAVTRGDNVSFNVDQG